MNQKYILLYLFAGILTAQDYKKQEFQATSLQGYVDSGLNQKDAALSGRFKPKQLYSGFSVAHVSNFSRISGLKGEFSWMRDTERIQTPSGQFSLRQEPLWLQFGVQLKDNYSSNRIKPFVHILGGAARFKTRTSTAANCAATFGLPTCPARFDSSRWSQAFTAGGGIDLRINARMDFRLIQADYLPMRRFGKTLHSFRFGLGVTFH